MRRFAAALVVIGLGALSCQVVVGLHDPVGHAAPPPPPPDSGPVDPCAHALPPGPPATDDDPSTTKTIWFAAQSIQIPLPADAGFDLDDSCTCEKDLHDGGAPCITPSATSPTDCDGPNGIDDSLGVQASLVPPALGLAVDAPANKSLSTGARTLLLYLSDYNDKANDSDVSVQFVDSGGLYTAAGCDGGLRDASVAYVDPDAGHLPGPRYIPLSDGCDRWSPVPSATIGNYPNKRASGALKAYVTDYTVVFDFDQLSGFVFGSSSTIANGKATARISTDANGIHHANGVIAGRVAFGDLLNLIGNSPVETSATALCDTPFWTELLPIACRSRDIMLSPSQEFQNQTCDATSLAIGFSLVEAQVDDLEFQHPLDGADCTHDVATACGP